jgi:hypothetical protein
MRQFDATAFALQLHQLERRLVHHVHTHRCRSSGETSIETAIATNSAAGASIVPHNRTESNR